MNPTRRSSPPFLSDLPPAAHDLEAGLLTTACEPSSCALFAPLHYEPRYAYPLIVWLHGPGGDTQQLRRIMPIVSMRNYVAVAPESVCPAATAPVECWPQTEDAIQRAEAAVFDAIAAAADRYHLARRRCFLAGFDSGGTMALRVALNRPTAFGGVLTFCGAFPNGMLPFRCINEARQMPILLAVGRDSSKYPPRAFCEDLRLLHTAGLSVTLRQYPCGQELTPQMLRDMDRWIIEQITSPPQ